MLYHNVRVMAHSLRFIDASAVALAAWATVRSGERAGLWPAQPSLAVVIFSGVLFVTFLVVAESRRIYHARRTEELSSELFALDKVALQAFGPACLATEIASEGLDGIVYLAALIVAAVALVLQRVAMRVTIRNLRRRGSDYRVWLVVGRNERSADLVETVLANPHFGIRIAAIVDVGQESPDDASAAAGPFARRCSARVPARTLASFDEVRSLVASYVIDEVVVTLPVRSCYDAISRILDICCEAGISVKLRPELFQKSGYYTEVSQIGSIPMVTHYSGPSNYVHLLVKRIIDLAGATVGLLLLSPLFLAIAACLKLSSPGPVFFRQTRVGLHGRQFQMIKFRSMVRDAAAQRDALDGENQRDGTAFKIRNDRRITPVGRWLRKYHLDELPQLWNVLVGDMSIVGPRPLPVREANGDEWWQRRRLTMPPGLTCLWQLADDPTMPFREWMRLDIAYIDRWSVWLDLKLIALTFVTLAKGRGW